MTRKRYIKLLMGKFKLSRNEARDVAAGIVFVKTNLMHAIKTQRRSAKKREWELWHTPRLGMMMCRYTHGLKKER